MTRICPDAAATAEAAHQIREAASAKKCWTCGCFHSSLQALEETNQETGSQDFKDAVEAGKGSLQTVKYDCLGCEICYPALAVNALDIEAACPTEEVEARDSWPPLPGDYTVCRYQSPVAVCTLTDGKLADLILSEQRMNLAVVGTMQTENLGIERLILNLVANPYIRFLIICGPDSRKTIGHLPGQSLVALANSGVDNNGRINEARGKRPLLRNVSAQAVEHFRRTVEVLDLIGCSNLDEIQSVIRSCAARNPGPAESFNGRLVEPIIGNVPERMVSDPAGYFVIYVDRQRRLLSLEHYRANGTINAIIEGRTPAELYTPALELGLASRFDHAAYLGQELARAQHALLSNETYVQDAAPERDAETETLVACGCASTSGGKSC